MLKTVYFDAHHRHKWQCFRIRLVDKGQCTKHITYELPTKKKKQPPKVTNNIAETNKIHIDRGMLFFLH